MWSAKLAVKLWSTTFLFVFSLISETTSSEIIGFEIVNGKIQHRKNENVELKNKVYNRANELEMENWDEIWKNLHDQMAGWWDWKIYLKKFG